MDAWCLTHTDMLLLYTDAIGNADVAAIVVAVFHLNLVDPTTKLEKCFASQLPPNISFYAKFSVLFLRSRSLICHSS